MKTNNKKKFYLLASLFSLVFNIIISSNLTISSVYADDATPSICSTDPNNEKCIVYKAIFLDLYNCFENKMYKTPIKASEITADNASQNSQITKKLFNNTSFKQYLPTGFANIRLSKNDNKALTCEDIADGKWEYQGLRSIEGIIADTRRASDLEALMKNYGYAKTTSTGDSQDRICIKIHSPKGGLPPLAENNTEACFNIEKYKNSQKISSLKKTTPTNANNYFQSLYPCTNKRIEIKSKSLQITPGYAETIHGQMGVPTYSPACKEGIPDAKLAADFGTKHIYDFKSSNQSYTKEELVDAINRDYKDKILH